MATISIPGGAAALPIRNSKRGSNGRGKGIRRGDAWRHIFVWALIAFTVFPIYVVIVSSFDPAGGLASS
jgi:ABC-type glycerol-3-phosphate transport system permease component